MKFLIEIGAQPHNSGPYNTINESLESSRDLETIDFFLKNGASVCNSFYENTINQALRTSQSLDVVRLLYNHGARPENRRDYDNNTMGVALSGNSDLQMVQFLIEKGAVFSSRNNHSIVNKALLSDSREPQDTLNIIDLLLRSGAELTEDQIEDISFLKEDLALKAGVGIGFAESKDLAPEIGGVMSEFLTVKDGAKLSQVNKLTNTRSKEFLEEHKTQERKNAISNSTNLPDGIADLISEYEAPNPEVEAKSSKILDKGGKGKGSSK